MNAVVSPVIMEKLLHRATALGATKSEYASLVIKHWFALGCPPVNEAERRELEKLVPATPAAAGL